MVNREDMNKLHIKKHYFVTTRRNASCVYQRKSPLRIFSVTYGPEQKIWNKIKKPSKIEHD